MIAVDSNIFTRFYCDDPDDPQSKHQRPLPPPRELHPDLPLDEVSHIAKA